MSFDLDNLVDQDIWKKHTDEIEKAYNTDEYKKQKIENKINNTCSLILEHFNTNNEYKKYTCSVFEIDIIPIDDINNLIKILDDKGYACHVANNTLYIDD